MSLYGISQQNVNAVTTYPFKHLAVTQQEIYLHNLIQDLMLYIPTSQVYFLQNVSASQMVFKSQDLTDVITFTLYKPESGWIKYQPFCYFGFNDSYVRGTLKLAELPTIQATNLHLQIHSYCCTPMSFIGCARITINQKNIYSGKVKLHLTQNAQFKNKRFDFYSYAAQERTSQQHLHQINGVCVDGKYCIIKPQMLGDLRVVTQDNTVNLRRLSDD